MEIMDVTGIRRNKQTNNAEVMDRMEIAAIRRNIETNNGENNNGDI